MTQLYSSKKYVRITSDNVTSNISNFDFSWEYISSGGKKSATYLNLIDAFYMTSNHEIIKREYQKHELKKSGLVLARLALQVFDNQLSNLSEDERQQIITDGTGNTIGLWSDKEALRLRWGNSENAGKKPSVEYVADMYIGNAYPSSADAKYFFNNSGLFDSIKLAQSLLSMFGNENDYFEIEVAQLQESTIEIETDSKIENIFISNYTTNLSHSKNIILRGAPGTGKSFLAKQIAADIISNGATTDVNDLRPKQIEQIGFVQFHPSYDYTDFVEGLRPVNTQQNMTFELTNGIFKEFCETAALNQQHNLTNHEFTREGFKQFLTDLGGKKAIHYPPYIDLLLGIKQYRGDKVELFPTYSSLEELIENIDEIKIFDKEHGFRQWLITPMNYLQKYYDLTRESTLPEHVLTDKNYVFIIDEINRGEISKIFGELFFSIDPGYRGKAGSVLTQYSSLHEDPTEKFYIPENVYIIGTMNDIDRSVDSFDFAMRRRFRFIEVKSEDSEVMLYEATDSNGEQLLSDSLIEEAIQRMRALNQLISSGEIPELNRNYHVGASYFLKLNELDGNFDILWHDFIGPLLEEYLRGCYDESTYMTALKDAYNLVD